MGEGLSKQRFEAVFNEGIRVNGKHCRIASLSGTGRLGFATPKKLGTVPRRNRVKRRLREAVRISQGRLSLTWDCIFIAAASAESTDFEELRTDVAAAIEKLRARWESESACS